MASTTVTLGTVAETLKQIVATEPKKVHMFRHDQAHGREAILLLFCRSRLIAGNRSRSHRPTGGMTAMPDHPTPGGLQPGGPAAALRQLIMGFRSTQLVRTAAELGLADHLTD